MLWKNRHNLNRPVHFVTYFYLFQYHQQLMSCGTSQNAYADAATKMNSMLDQGQSVDRRVLRKAYEIFIHALNYDMEKAWGCARCPRSLGQDEHELDFDGVIEVHIADGINMGTAAALKEYGTFYRRKSELSKCERHYSKGKNFSCTKK